MLHLCGASPTVSVLRMLASLQEPSVLPKVRIGVSHSPSTKTSMNRILKRALLLGLSSVLVVQAGLHAQDVELLGKHHGTKPPQGYYDRMAQDPGAFQFQRALLRRGLGLKELPRVQTRGRALSSVLSPDLVGALAGGAQRAAVAGSFKFPLILGLFSDSPTLLATYSQGNVQKEFFNL